MNDRQHQLNIERQRWQQRRQQQLNEEMPSHSPHMKGQPVGNPGVNNRVENEVDTASDFERMTGLQDVSTMQRKNARELSRQDPAAVHLPSTNIAMRDLGRGYPFSITTNGVTQSFEVAGPIEFPFDPKKRIGYEIRVMVGGQWDRLDWFFDDDDAGDPKAYGKRIAERRLGIQQDTEDKDLEHGDHSNAERKELDKEMSAPTDTGQAPILGAGDEISLAASYKPKGDLT